MAHPSARSLAVAAGLLAATGAQAHHSYTEFDQRQTVEIEGTLLVMAWQNPHTHLEVRALDSSNREVVWTIETGSINSMRRQQAPIELFKVGGVVKVAGWPSKRSGNRLYATNLLGGGRELMFQTSTPRWPSSGVYREAFNATTSTAAVGGTTATLFRVWSSDARVDSETRNGFLTRAQVSLTEAAQRAVAAFDPVTQSTSTGCTPKGMPILMGQPFPIEFVDQGDTIRLRLEEFDAVRTIRMAGAAPAASQAPSLLGYSGRALGRCHIRRRHGPAPLAVLQFARHPAWAIGAHARALYRQR